MIWEKLLNIDRRIVFLIMGLGIVLPLLFPTNLPVSAQRVTQRLFKTVDEIDSQEKCLFISGDYAPQNMPETHPMVIALLRHGFAAHIPVLVNALYVEGAPLLASGIEQVMDEFNGVATSHADSIIYGRDVVYLGWQPPPIVPILGMGEDIHAIYPVDYRGNDIDSLELMKHVHTYDDIGIVTAITGLSAPLWYVMFAQTKYGLKVGAGCTAVCAPDFYPYCATGQISGMMAGMKGAAEYEGMVVAKYGTIGRRKATEGMVAQSAAHLCIMGFVILGNLAYFMMRREKEKNA